jgi:hypothetical protein
MTSGYDLVELMTTKDKIAFKPFGFVWMNSNRKANPLEKAL